MGQYVEARSMGHYTDAWQPCELGGGDCVREYAMPDGVACDRECLGEWKDDA